MRVALVCHFSNEEIRNKLELRNDRFLSTILKVFGRKPLFRDFAPWISGIAYNCKDRADIDLHIIAPHSGMKHPIQEFVSDRISYHFFSGRLPFPLNYFETRYRSNYKRNTSRVNEFIHRIRPDLVVLVGTENPYYSSTVLNIKDTPVFILCQIVYNDPTRIIENNSTIIKMRLEKALFRSFDCVGVYCKKHYDLLRALGYNGNIFHFQWPSRPFPTVQEVDKKEYDFINFAANLSEQKGFHDSIRALSIVKKEYPNVRLNIVDGGPLKVKEELVQLINELGLQNNVSFTPFFTNRDDLFQHLKYSRFAVLPCKLDNYSGTMIQSMYYGLPLVVYETTGTPSFNIEKPCVLIAKMNDISDLASQMCSLMRSPSFANELATNAHDYIVNQNKKNDSNFQLLVDEFNAVIGHYSGKSIPSELLYESLL